MDDEEFTQKVPLVAYKELDKITEGEAKLLEIEKNRCRSFVYFLKYGKLFLTPTIKNPGGVIPLQLWPHIKTIVKALLEHRQISIAKARQIGISTIIAYYVLWFALFHEAANILLFSRGEDEAKELLGKAIRLYDQLPPFLRIQTDPKSTEVLGFPSMKSRIKAFAATASAGIGETASIVVCDEHAEHPYAEENYRAVRPTLSASGGQFISVWTKNPWELDTLATRLFIEASENKNDFHWLFFPWNVVPSRDKAFYETEKRAIPEEMLAKLGVDLYMQANFPASLEELLSRPQTISAFDGRVLTEMLSDTKNPIEVVRDGIDPLVVKVYKDFHIGDCYIAGTDTSHGVGQDFSVTAIMNVRTGTVVADIMNNLLHPEELALHSVRLLDIFQKPLWFIEVNDWGAVTLSTAQNLGYKNFGYQDGKRTKLGLDTKGGKEGIRNQLWGQLIPAINNHQITIYNKDGVRQFFDVIRNIKKSGRIEAASGRHDDYPVAVGICWLKKDAVHTEWNIETTKTLTFSGRR